MHASVCVYLNSNKGNPFTINHNRKEYEMNTRVLLLVARWCLTLCDPTDCGPPGSSVHGILQGRILEWIAISFSRESSQPRHRSFVSCIDRWILYC